MTNDILDFAKIEAGRLELETLNFNLNSLLDEFAAPMALRAQEKGLEFICFADPDVPEFLQGDPNRLRQILNNLASNAIKFTQAGQVLVQVSLAASNPSILDPGGPNHCARGTGEQAQCEQCADQQKSDPGQNLDRAFFSEQSGQTSVPVCLLFQVQDTGLGIPSDKLGELFDKFTQVETSMTRRFEGTGLGLAIARQLVQMMSGEIWVQSSQGQGSTFWFTAKFNVQHQQDIPGDVVPEKLNNIKVLVVVYNFTNRGMLVRQLSYWGLQPGQAEGGEAALKQIAAAHEEGQPYDLVLVDMDMPDMNGKAICRAIKSESRFQDLPLVALTPLGQPRDPQECAQTGFKAYLNKPVRRAELQYILCSVLFQDQGARQTVAAAQGNTVRDKKKQLTESPRFSGQVLLVEDNAVNQKVALGVLHKLGLTAEVAGDGFQALQALQYKNFDLVLMDVQMPEMDGLEATRQIRQMMNDKFNMVPESPDQSALSTQHPSFNTHHLSLRMPIVAMTAQAMQGDRERCIQAGMDDYLTKPVEPGALARILQNYLPQSEKGQQTEQAKDSGQNAPGQTFSAYSHNQQAEIFVEEELLERFQGDQTLLSDILQQSVKDIPERIQGLKNSLHNNDAQNARFYAHSIKGMAGNLSAHALQQVALDLENLGASEDKSGMQALLPELEQEFARFKEVLQKYLA